MGKTKKIIISLFKDANPVKLFMPTWELHNLLKCKSQCSLDVSEDTVHIGFVKWGGIPRYVLEAHDFAHSMAEKFVKNEIEVPSLFTTWGKVFKILAHKKLVKGGTFTTRNLEDRQIYSAGPATVEIRKVEDISRHREQSCYLKPTVKNFVAVDGIMPLARGFQITVKQCSSPC